MSGCNGPVLKRVSTQTDRIRHDEALRVTHEIMITCIALCARVPMRIT